MAAVTKKDIPEISEFMAEFWGAVKTTWIVEENDEYWNDTITRLTDLDHRYPYSFCHKQILAYLEHLESEYKKKKVSS